MRDKYDFNKNRNRRRFKAIWIGPRDDDGFVDNQRLYTITEVFESGHYAFINNFGKPDLAHYKYFSVVRPPKIKLTGKV